MLTEMMTRPAVIDTPTPATTNALGEVEKLFTGAEVLCELQQDDHTETADVAAVSTWTLFLPPGTTITPESRVTAGGQTFDVRGAPWEARDPISGAISHIEATLVLSTGSAGLK
ncbi:MAG: hypothetical protein PGN13_16345 [Patulibacter minatonensis]